ncbi:hypothetical protein [Brevundimonas sp.]|uniref:hypothetical protein n=1 Tax=Brevundimonas sp. TaxID=1871086 RepID=UPI00286C8662|nr:hypothetical protein [Brevundimonas sp.]
MTGSTRTETAKLRLRLDQHANTVLNPDDCFVALRRDGRKDLWMLFPVSEVTAEGRIVKVADQMKGPRDLTDSEWSQPRYAFSLKGRATNDAMIDLCWRPYAGLQALRMACAEVMNFVPDTVH